MFGNYAMNYFNSNTEIASDKLTEKTKSYVRSIFDVAEILGYIEFNRTTKVIQSVTAPKKIALRKKRENSRNQSLTAKELLNSLDDLSHDLENWIRRSDRATSSQCIVPPKSLFFVPPKSLF